ncbi:MAG: hypothetical protein RIM33_15005 [Alphaproteobacteria bacterium]
MSTLNSELSPASIPSYVKRSFKNGKMQKVDLRPGMVLFTVSNYPRIDRNGQTAEFWSPFKKFKHDRGFDARVEAMKLLSGTDRADVFRSLSAFFGKKPGGRYALVAKLRVPVVGFMGPIRRQGKSAAQISAATSGGDSGSAAAAAPGSGKNLIGYQIYIPGLTSGQTIVRARRIDLLTL